MKANEVLLSRLDSLNAGLSSAVQEAGGARFALLLSMINDAQLRAQQSQEASDATAGPAKLSGRDGLYTPEVVERLNQALHAGQTGEYGLLISWLETAPLPAALPVEQSAMTETAVPMAQAALMASQYSLLDEVKESRLRLAA